MLKSRTSSCIWRIIRFEAMIGANCPKAMFHVSSCVTAYRQKIFTDSN